MINFEQAKLAFKEYLQGYELDNNKIKLKIKHTYGVVNVSEYIAKNLLLDAENIELAKLIGLLHDIGRFKQVKLFNSFIDSKTVDHAILGNKILFEDNVIQSFTKDEQYYDIISKAILNHNKLAIESALNDIELLHSKIIRDADKIDIFRVVIEEAFEDFLSHVNRESLENSLISEKIFNDFMNDKVIVRKEIVTDMDSWIAYLAFIYDFNFLSSLEYIKQMDYVNKMVNRLNYKHTDTKQQMEKARKHANEYIENKLIDIRKDGNNNSII